MSSVNNGGIIVVQLLHRPRRIESARSSLLAKGHACYMPMADSLRQTSGLIFLDNLWDYRLSSPTAETLARDWTTEVMR